MAMTVNQQNQTMLFSSMTFSEKQSSFSSAQQEQHLPEAPGRATGMSAL